MELVKLYTALLRRKWLVIQSFVFFVTVAIILALVLPKNYLATSRVLVSSSDSTMSILSELGLSELALGMTDASDDIANTIALATTRPLLEDLIWRLQLRDSDGRLYTAEELLVPGLLGEVEARPNLAITQQQGTDLLLFEASANDPQLARLLADTAVQLAVRRSQDRAREDTRGARLFVERQLGIVEQEFDSAMQNIADAQAAEEVLDLETEMKAAVGRISELMLSFEQNAAAIQDTRARLIQQRRYVGTNVPTQVSSYVRQSNPKVLSLEQKLITLREERAKLRLDRTEQHPDVRQIDQLIVDAGRELDVALAEQRASDPSVQQLEAQLSGLIEKGAEIQASIERTTETFGAYPDKMRRLAQLQLAANAAEEVYGALQEQRYQIGVAEAMLVSELLPVEAAILPDRHYSPKVLVNLVVGAVLGLSCGLGLALLFEYIDDSVKTPEDLAEIWEIPRLGIIPRFRGSDRRGLDQLPNTHPLSEAFRTVRNGLLYASLDKPLRIIAVSSAMPGEGKSTCTVNLGISFAREGKRVLIVDCDIRRPAQHRSFPSTSNHQGMTDVLTGKLDAAEAIQQTPVENLFLLTSGPIPTDPARLVESLRLRQLLLDLQKIYDVVLVDTPPSMVVNDALVISRVVDGTVLVVESGRTSRKLVADMRDRFESAGIEPLGLVLNKLDFNTSGYGHYQRAYQAYQSKAPASPPSEPRSSGGAA